jgi:hypothetical protein
MEKSAKGAIIKDFHILAARRFFGQNSGPAAVFNGRFLS